MITQRIGFLGSGQMAQALAGGMVSAGLVGGEQLSIYDLVAAAREAFQAAAPGAKAEESAPDLVSKADVIVLAVKPQQLAAVAEEAREAISGDKLCVSIAAGVRLAQLCQWLGTERVVRVMPNTPCLVGKCAAGYCLGPGATAADGRLVGRILESVGVAFAVDERLMDAVTGLAGSGPAYIYVVIEALSDAGVKMGLPRAMATALAAQTVAGAAEMVLRSGEHPGVLKDRVASPGGTTIAGLAALEDKGLRAALIAAVEAATRRSVELGGLP